MTEKLHNLPDLRAQKANLIARLQRFYNQSSRAGYAQSLTLTDDDLLFTGERRKDISPNVAKRLLSNPKFANNPRRWYTVEQDEKGSPYMVITDYYLAPLVIVQTKLFPDPSTPPEALGYVAKEMHLIAEKMMLPGL